MPRGCLTFHSLHATYMAVSPGPISPRWLRQVKPRLRRQRVAMFRGPVAHLVGRVACVLESLVGDQVLVCKIILIGRLELAAGIRAGLVPFPPRSVVALMVFGHAESAASRLSSQ